VSIDGKRPDRDKRGDLQRLHAVPARLPAHVIEMATDRVNAQGYYPALLVDPEGNCTGCAICAVACPDVCITVYRQVSARPPQAAAAAAG